MDYNKLQPMQASINAFPYPDEGLGGSTKKELLPDIFTGPVEKRRKTNVEFLVIFGVFIAVWFCLAFYCIANGDLSRIHVETDESSADYLKTVAKNIKSASGEIYIACSCAIVLSALLIVLFRRFSGVIVWLVVGFMILCCVVTTLTMWYLWKQEKDQRHQTQPDKESSGLFVGAIFWTVFTIILCLVIYAIRKNIKMVVRLFTEGGKVAQAMPLILLQPFVTLLVLTATVFLWVYFFLYIESAGVEVVNEYGVKTLEKDEIMLFARGYNFIALLWINQFFIGCQHMVIAGATATWFFTRDKNNVRNALKKSYTYLCKYHLGSVCLGSLLITIVQILRWLYRMARSNNRSCIGFIARVFCKYLERFVTFLTRNAYIEIAIFGDGFWVSGKRAFNVLTNNAVKVSTINCVGDFVMLMGRAAVVASAVGIGYLLMQGKPDITDNGAPLFIIGVVALVVSHAFMNAFEMIVDSLFICFCEDCDINDGIQRPYFMSKELMIFINKDRNKVLRVGDADPEK